LKGKGGSVRNLLMVLVGLIIFALLLIQLVSAKAEAFDIEDYAELSDLLLSQIVVDTDLDMDGYNVEGVVNVTAEHFYYPNGTELVSQVLSGNLTDTNASTACDGEEVLLGNGSCYNITDIGSIVDTNASTACDAGEVLLGDGSCYNITDIDTNESIRVKNIVATNCTGDVVAGFYPNGTGFCENDNTGADPDNRWLNNSNYLYIPSEYPQTVKVDKVQLKDGSFIEVTDGGDMIFQLGNT